MVFGFRIPPPSARWEAALHATVTVKELHSGSPVCKLQVTHKHQRVDFKWPKQTSDPGLLVSSLPQKLARCRAVGMSELSLQPQQTIRQGPRIAEPRYDWSWLAADGTAVPVGVLSANSSLAYTHTPGMGLQERPEDKQASAAQPALSLPWEKSTVPPLQIHLIESIRICELLPESQLRSVAQARCTSRLTACREVTGRGETWWRTKLPHRSSINKLPCNTNITSPYSKQVGFYSLDSL